MPLLVDIAKQKMESTVLARLARVLSNINIRNTGKIVEYNR